MKYTPFVYYLGKATITRIEEMTFDLMPNILFPDWDVQYSRFFEEHLSTATLDLINQRVVLQTHLWVVQIDDLTIVVDTGIGNAKPRPFSKLFDMLDNPLLKRFEEAGFQPEDVDYVLLTHLHVDHVGWNTHWQEGKWTPVFPNATYVYSQQEVDFFDTPAGSGRRMVFEDSVLPIIEAGLARTVQDEGEEITEGIRFLPTPGHSIGHMAIEVNTGGEIVIFSGDVMHSPLQVYRPEWNSMFCLDKTQAQNSRKWLLEYALTNDATIFAAHFPETSAGKVQRGKDGYKWSYVTM